MREYCVLASVFIITSLGHGCSTNNSFEPERSNLISKTYVLNQGWSNVDTFEVVKKRNDGICRLAFYNLPDTINSSIYTLFDNDTSIILYNGDTCLYIAGKTFEYKGRTVNYRKYKYDLPFSYDEECSIFVLENSVVSLKSEVWLYEFNFYNSVDNDLINRLFKDTSGFYWGVLVPYKKLEPI